MYRYANQDRTAIVDLDRPGTCIPTDPRNADFQRVQAWVQAGNSIQEPEATPAQPKSDAEIIAEQIDALVKAAGAQPTPEFKAVLDRMAAKRAKRA
jgi:hypothetical protein